MSGIGTNPSVDAQRLRLEWDEERSCPEADQMRSRGPMSVIRPAFRRPEPCHSEGRTARLFETEDADAAVLAEAAVSFQPLC